MQWFCIADITKHPDTQWTLQMARQLTDTADGILLSTRYLILDRDTKYCTSRDFVKREGIEAIRLPPRSPNLNAYAEKWVRDACLSRLIPIGPGCCGVRFENTAPIFIKNASTKASAMC
jgi:putative transposase